MSGAEAQIARGIRKSQSLGSIFDISPPSTTVPGHAPVPAVTEPALPAGTPRPIDTESKNFLIVQAGGLTIALEAALVREVTRFPGPEHFDSGPLSTIVHVCGRNLIFSALDSLLGLPTRHLDANTPIAIVGDQHKEAALMVDRISGIVDATRNEISGRELFHPHQIGWLARKSGGRAAIIDLRQILGRVLFETNRRAK